MKNLAGSATRRYRAMFQNIFCRGLMAAMGVVLITAPSHAQVLNQEVTRLLLGNCAGLGFVDGGSAAASGVGQNLYNLCAFPPTSASNGSSGGGGAASVQAASLSILNRNLVSRLEDIREESTGTKSARASSLVMNPFGAFAPGLLRGFGMGSPTSPTGDSSGTSFNLANQGRWKGVGFFATGLVEALNRDVTTFQDGYNSTILGVTAGADYRFNQKTVAGIAVNYSNTHGDFTGGGDFNTNSIGATLFGSYLPTDRTFIQVSGGYSNNNYLVSRLANVFIAGSGGPDRSATGFASSNTNGDIFSANVLAGYDHPIGMFTIGPRLGFNYMNTHIHSFAESGATGIEMQYNDQYVNSVQTLLGVQGQAAINTGWGVLVPQVNADYIHEYANSQRFINVQFVEDLRANPTKFAFQNEAPVRNWFNLGTGLIMVLPNGWQPFVNFRAMVGNEQFNNYAGTFGARIEM